ncbi:hypothetical protein KC366_g9855 [Hortaea werneckii]|nr:hypothetical protein KC358_g9214 [Hortaea werneckii]KAI6829112.1 hypothetical protein KC350_g7932 [Hortaea werneckii]KAI6943693.1 hypothetical protein KC341_g1334 [Hortaea werneckii]KAI6946767.1 hypothetical protein KC348_g2917 [Hortaea werneckii]KAI6983172.1 hypothetical protein KC321_g231 [Hortaea werneckii]
MIEAHTNQVADSQGRQNFGTDHAVALLAEESRTSDHKNILQQSDGVEATSTVLQSQASTERQPSQKTKQADTTITYFEHLKVCQSCREHEIEAFGDRIKVLKRLDPSSSQKGGDTSLLASNALEEIAFRLVFNSTDLMKILEKITEDEITAANPVHVRPFKYLLKHESKIRSALEQIQQALHTHSGDPSVGATEALQGHPTDLSTTETVSTTVEGVPVTERNLKLLRCLMGFIDNEMRDILSVRKQIAGGTLEEVSFEYLLHLFKPGDLVFADPRLPTEERRAYRVLYVTGGRPLFESSEERRQRLKKSSEGIEAEKAHEIGGFEIFPDEIVSQGSQGKATKMTPLVVDCFYMDYDGTNYGPRPQRFIIPEFGGRKKIVDLDVYPAHFDTACETVRGKLLRRGKYFVDCRNRPHKEYHGYVLPERVAILSADVEGAWFKIYNDPGIRSEVFQLDCECIIDQKATLDRYTPSNTGEVKGVTTTNKLGFHSGVLSKPTDSNQSELFDKLGRDKDQSDMYDDSRFDIDLRTQFISQTTLLSSSREITEDEQIELLPLRVFGYALQKRKWYAFNVLHLRDPPAMKEEERNKAFNALVLPQELRRTIRALVSHQVREITTPKDDLDDGGRDFGFQRAPHTTTGDLQRNSLVSVFLRQLEYYSRLLILTTNRVGEFDEAFVSRIHMKLHFPSLDEGSTMEVGDMNLRKLQERSSIEIRSKGIKKFAADYWKQNESQWNGRQIKNAFQTAVALAYWDWEQERQEALANGKKARDKPVLRRTHFEDVAKTSLHFDNSMDKLYGAIGVDGKRRKGAFVREAERLRYRHDDRAQELAPPTPYARGGVSTTAGRPAGATANASTLTVDDLQRQLDALRAGNPGPTLSSATAGASKDDASSSEDSSDDDSDED